MNLLGMKRKLLPYGMPLGGMGGGSALGAMSQASPTNSAAPSGGGKSSPVSQNTYTTPFRGNAGGTSGPSMGGSKSSGAGQGGYGGAPGFGGQQTAQTQPSSTFSPYGAGDSSVYTTTQQDMMGGNRGNSGQDFGQVMQGLRGGKSSGAGQGGYGGAPGFGGQQQPQPGMMAPQDQRFRTPEQQAKFDQDKYQNSLNHQQRMSDIFGTTAMGGMGGMAAQRGMQGGFGPQAPTQDAYNNFRAMTGSPASFEEFSQSRGNKFMQQPGFGGQQQFNPFQQQFGGFQQQQQFNPFQQQFGGFQQQQPVSGLQGLFNSMMGQQRMQQPMQQMPRFQSQALQYRPNMQNAQTALSRVQPIVQKQGQDAQAARIAELEAQIAAFQPQTPTDYGNSGG